MSTGELLNEIKIKPEGKFARDYFKYLGFVDGPEKPVSPARARSIESLFTKTEPYIYKNDLIAGSVRCLYADVDDDTMAKASEMVMSFGERNFSKNYDHFAPNYRRILKDGIPGTIANIEKSKANHTDDEKKVSFLNDMEVTMKAFQTLLVNYSSKALSLKGTPGYDDGVLSRISENCLNLSKRAPETFEEGLQLVWLCHVCFVCEGRYAMALGRLDQYLFPLFDKDVKEGRITEEYAQILLENIFIKIYERAAVFGGGDDVVNICIGGSDTEENCQINRLSWCILNAVAGCGIPGPNLTCRVTDDMPEDFFDRCLEVIGTGLGYPALSSDKVNVAALSNYGYELEDIHDFCMVGCIENHISGKQPPWSDGRFDTPRFFEYVFNDGKAIKFPREGIDTGPVDTIDSMEEFMSRFETQVRSGVKEYVDNFHSYNYIEHPENFTSPFLSCFCDDCIGRGMDINDGGAKYPSVHGAATMGIGTTADSLAAIEQCVFVDKSLTLSQIKKALINDFEGMEDVRKTLLAAPKYGNNDDRADKYAVWYVDFLSGEFNKYKTRDGGGIYLIMAANVSNIYAGSFIGATPDGRKAGEPLSDAASPTYGRDTKGTTSAILSLVKPDYTKVASGTVVNQKFSPAAFLPERRKKLQQLFRVYFEKGGHEVQINATSRKVLQDAMDHPENYPTMVVRVSGFSAIYVTLDRSVQLDILNRTQHE